jgi:thiamine-phosphate pyrophosphorylase
VIEERRLFYYITDRTQFPGNEADRFRAVVAKIAEAASAGVDYIQLREKDLPGRDLERLAGEALAAVRSNSTATRLLINSRTDIALAIGADGIHLRSNDVAVEDVCSLWSEVQARSSRPVARAPIVAVSCHTVADVRRAQTEGADFAVFAPVFGKAGGTPAGLASLQEACKVKIPVLALGGVTLANAGACLEAGAAGIAGIRLFQGNRIGEVIRQLKKV